MRLRSYLCITLLSLCHAQMQAQLVTKRLPPENNSVAADSSPVDAAQPSAQEPPQPASQQPAPPAIPDAIPDAPSLQLLPPAIPVPAPEKGYPVRWEAMTQSRNGDDWTLTGEVTLVYRDYTIRADKVVYHQSTAIVEAEGHLQLEGGPSDLTVTASHAEIHVRENTATLYDVTGSMGVRRVGQRQIYSTADPFLFHGRMLIETGRGNYRIVDGAMTSCRLPKPDWQILSKSIEVANGKASTHGSVFQFLHIPVFYFPYLARDLGDSGRQTGILIPAFENSGVKGLVFGEWMYWAISRNMDLTAGVEYWSKRGWAPTGDFRYRGNGLDALMVRWNGLFDRGFNGVVAPATTLSRVKQGGADVQAFGRKDLSDHLRVAGAVEFLSSYIYRLAFDENYSQATSSEVTSDVALTHTVNGYSTTVALSRCQSFAGTPTGTIVTDVPEVRILHLPSIRLDTVDRPLGDGPLYWGLNASAADLDRAEPHFHARNVGRIDVYPHIEWPIHLGDWLFRPEAAVRATWYSGSQTPDLKDTNNGIPTVNHDPLTRADVEFKLNLRPPPMERDFALTARNRILRHVIEPELTYRYVRGINKAPETLRFDTTDIAVDTNEAGYSLTQRLYLKPLNPKPCPEGETCPTHPREWASWQIAQKFYIDPNLGGAVQNGQRNVFDTTLDLTAAAFMTSPRNIAPVISRVRFEAIDNLRVEWDLDYDTKGGRFSSDNLFAGYSIGRSTFGLDQALLNAVDESGSTASVIQSHLLQPFFFYGKPSDAGLSVALSSSYDFTHGALQYGGAEAIYNWNCCGLTVGYRRFALGSLRNEGEWLWGFTLSGLGTAGNIRRSTSVFPATDVLRRMY